METEVTTNNQDAGQIAQQESAADDPQGHIGAIIAMIAVAVTVMPVTAVAIAVAIAASLDRRDSGQKQRERG